MSNPRETPELAGHESAEAALAQAASGARLHHAWLIGGPRGIGKATLAYRFARHLLAAGGGASLHVDPAHPVFRRVAADTHADLMTVELGFDPVRKRQRTDIVVDDVRAVVAFLRLTPAEGGWRVVIVDGAEAMKASPANALLKVLEEPPPRSVLLLVSHAPGALLPTLRSRCRALSLTPLADPVLDGLLAARLPELDAMERARLVRLADGSLGHALRLADQEGLAYAALAEEVLASVPGLSAARIGTVADQVARGDTGFSTFIDLLRRLLAAAIGEVARGNRDSALAQRLASSRSLASWSEIWLALGRLRGDTERFYMDKRQAVVDALTLLG